MSEHEMQSIIDGVVEATLKSKRQWDIAKIASVLGGSLLTLWAVAFYCGALVSTQNSHERRINSLEEWRNSIQNTQNQRRAAYNKDVTVK